MVGEREVLNFRKTVAVVEGDKQLLENELSRLKSYIAQLTQ